MHGLTYYKKMSLNITGGVTTRGTRICSLDVLSEIPREFHYSAEHAFISYMWAKK